MLSFLLIFDLPQLLRFSCEDLVWHNLVQIGLRWAQWLWRGRRLQGACSCLKSVQNWLASFRCGISLGPMDTVRLPHHERVETCSCLNFALQWLLQLIQPVFEETWRQEANDTAERRSLPPAAAVIRIYRDYMGVSKDGGYPKTDGL